MIAEPHFDFDGSTSMKRALVFLLLGPASVVFAIWVASGLPTGDFVVNIAVLLFACTFPVSAIIGLLDGYMARAFPILLRASLTTLVGATAAFVLPQALLGPLPQGMSMLLVIGGAICAGACSLLAHDYRNRKTGAGDTDRSRS
jgi:hypothetical protein